MLLQNGKDCVLELELIFDETMSESTPNLLVLHRRAIGRNMEFHMDFVEGAFAIDGYYIDTGVWPPHYNPEEPNNTLMIVLSVVGGLLVIGIIVLVVC
jgi:hypothetical protein